MQASGHGLRARRAVVLLSGGLDSATTLAIALRDGFAPFALTVDYGQRHRVEIEAARQLAAVADAVHCVVHVPLDTFGASSLTADAPIPKDRSREAILGTIPSTYVPARNTVLLSLALAWAETLGAFDLFIGATAVDYSGYPDCRPEFVAAFERVANLATAAADADSTSRFRIHAPLVHLSKAEIIRIGVDLGVDFGLTSTCYDPTPQGACGRCDACIIRLEGFRAAGLRDPAPYYSRPGDISVCS